MIRISRPQSDAAVMKMVVIIGNDAREEFRPHF